MNNTVRRLFVLISSSLAGVSITSSAMAQATSDSTVPINGLDGVQSWRALDDGRLEITFEDGRVVTLEADQFTLIDGTYHINISELDALGISSAGPALSTGQLLATAGQLVGMTGLGLVGGGDDSQNGQMSSQPNSGLTFTSMPSASAEEGQTIVYDANVSGAGGAAIDFSISGADADLFTIDPETGVVTFITPPDYENPGDADGDNVYEFTVTADNGTDSSSEVVSVAVTNSNDIPTFSGGPAVSTTNEGELEVYDADASDAEGATISYEIGGADADLFTIDPETGVVTFIEAPDYENPGDADGDNVYEFTVTASDGTNSVDETVSVTVVNTNDSMPVFLSDSSASTGENLTAVYHANASDAEGDPIHYSLSGADAALFAIDAATGEVTFITPPDYENPGDADGDNVYEFTVTASDGTHSSHDAVTVTVTDSNDMPVFSSGGSAVSTADEGDSEVYDADASDDDGDPIHYSLSGADAALFAIDAGTGEVTFITPPDYENPGDANGDNIYEFTVTASDGTHSSSEAVTVTVNDSNDIPTFSGDSVIFTADEGESEVYDADASDDDGDVLYYSLSGVDAELFAIDAATGVVTFITPPDYENPSDADGDNIYEFTVTASDGVTSCVETVTVTVNNTNDSVPTFSSEPATSTADEGTMEVYDADARDADGDPINYSLSGADADLFTIDAETGEVSFIVPPDYENPADANGDNVYEFTVTASDGVTSGDETVTVTVHNTNDTSPVFDIDSTAPNIVEEDQTFAYNADAIDADGDDITYSLSGTDAALFTIDAGTGVLSFITAPDYENPHDANGDNVYEFIVSAADGENSTDRAVSVTVDNANDSVPIFSGSPSASVNENQTVAYDADASDADGDAITYSLSGEDAALFSINGATGVVSFIIAPDYESPVDADGDHVYEFTVNASDGVNTSEEHVIITVDDINDNAPVFTSGDVASHQENQTAAYNANASDADGDDITYSISGTDAALLTINSDNGVVSFIDPPDFESPRDANGDNVYEFTVTASDGETNIDQSVSVTVTNANDNAPIFNSGSSASMNETYTVAYDADASDINNDPITYSLSGTDAALFTIDTTSGVVSFIIAPDFENPGDDGGDNDYEITVTASDGAFDTAEDVTVTVMNLNDNSPEFSSGTTATVVEDQTLAYNADVSDADGDDVTYSISGTDAALFTIDAATGVVSFITAPDYETPGDANDDNDYEFTVTASDGSRSMNQAVTVTVANVNDSAPIFTSSASGSATENGTAAYSTAASDTDGDTLTYSLSGTDAALFTIDTTSGAVSFITAPDFENPGDEGGDNEYDVLVTASDGVHSTDQAVTVTVTNVNDNAPAFTSGTTATVVEDQTLAYNADASDADGDDVTYSLSGADAALFTIDAGTGVVSFITAPDYETPGDADSDNDYEFTVTASDGARSTGQSVTVSVTNINDSAPIFSSSGSASVDENETAAYSAIASDADGDTLTYSLSGTDAGLFTIDTASGVVSFIAAPDFENPADDGGDNEYEFQVTASDGTHDISETVIVSVDDVFEPASVIDLTSLNATQGFIIQGDEVRDYAGYSASSAGDVNGDGYDDMIVGAFDGEDGGDNAGEAYVIFGSASGFGAADGTGRQVIDLTTLTAAQGFIIQGGVFSGTGVSVSSAGDVNGDGYDDMIVGAYRGGEEGDDGVATGEAYVVFGSADGFGTSVTIAGHARQVIDITSLSAAQGFIIHGQGTHAYAGLSVSSAGDINGDGYDDVIVGAGGGRNGGAKAGEAYVVFGTASDFGTPVTTGGHERQVIRASTLSAEQGFIIQGDDGEDFLGGSVSSAGDINGDGYDDMIIGAYKGDDGGFGAGEAYVVFGSASGFGTSVTSSGGARQVIDLTSLSAAQGFIIQGDVAGDDAGRVSSAGDINGDGYDDLIVGASEGDDGGSDAGEAYVLFGSAGGFGTSVTSSGGARQVIDLTSLSAAQGFIIQGDEAGDYAGLSVSSAGDINGDGYDDMIVAARNGDDGGSRAGEAYVVFGSAGGFGTSVTTSGGARQVIDLTNLTAVQGFIIQGDVAGDNAGSSVSSAGDIDGDGYDDLIVGAWRGDDGGDNAGEAYVIYGGPMAAGTADQSITGTAGADTLRGSDGDDSITGLGGADAIRGGAGDDVIAVADLSFADIDGGSGSDTLALTGTGQTLDLTASSGSALPAEINSIEMIDLTGSGDNTLVLDALAVLDTSNDTTGGVTTLTVQGDAGDVVNIAGWSEGANTTVDAVTYDIYTDGNVQMLIEQGVTVSNAAPVIDLTSLSSAQGFIIQSDVAIEFAGHTVSSAGDMNGDGYDDIIVGVYFGFLGGDEAGEAYVVFGTANGFGTADGDGRQVIDLISLTAAQGFIIQGEVMLDYLGTSVSSAGDVNGDGYDDLIVGAQWGDDGGDDAGEAYVVFGSAGGFGTSVTSSGGTRQVIDMTSLSAAEGFIIQGDANFDSAGFSVSTAGDVNGDGYDDMIIGATRGGDGGTRAGEAYVVFGSASGFGTSVTTSGGARQVIDLTSLSAAQGFIIQGDVGGDRLGRTVSSAGDVNGDGYDDMIVGTREGDDGGFGAGEAYVLFGGAGGFGTSVTSSGGARQVIDLTSLSAAQGFIIQGDEAGDSAGFSVSTAGDINGDGYDDMIVGTFNGDDGGDNAGETYVLFGSAGGFGTSVTSSGGARQVIDLTSLSAAQGFIIQGDEADDGNGFSVSSAGDVNGDGYDDIFIGAPYGDDGGSNAGEAYVVFGSAGGFGTSVTTGVHTRQVIDLTDLTAAQGFIIQGDMDFDRAGTAVSSAGDIDGDGYDDLIIAARHGNYGGSNEGEAYVIYGGPMAAGDADRSITGTAGAETLTGSDGDDSITGLGGADVIRGGAGDDVIAVADLSFADIDGGSGSDTLALTGTGQTFDLTASSGSALPAEINSIEVIDLTGSGDNTLVLDALAVLDTSNDTTGGVTTLTVQGDAGDVVNILDWTQGASTTVDGVTYDIYTDGNVQMLIEQGVTVDTSPPPAAVIDLTTLDSTQGFIIQGDRGNDEAGYSVSSAGDVNGDGFDDMIVGAIYGGNGGADAGEAYVIFGTDSGFGTQIGARQVIDLTSLSAAQGFVIQGDAAGDRAGGSVSSAGDVNGDGYDDMIIGAKRGDDGGNDAGNAYVVFGTSVTTSGGARQDIDLTSLSAAEGFIIQGDAAGDYTGFSVSSVGDVNGDGYDDMIVGARNGDDGGTRAGEAYVVFGSASGFGTSVTTSGGARQVIDLTSLSAAQGFIIQGDEAGDWAGYSVSSAGDVNGDGFDDMIVGAIYGDDGGFNAGEAYVVFGSAGGFGTSVTTSGGARQVIDLTSLSAAEGFIIQGDEVFDWAGYSVSSAGDVNGDGFDDMIVGTRYGDDGGNWAGEAYVLFGSAGGFGTSVTSSGGARQVIDLTSLSAAQGFIIQGDEAYDVAGGSISSAGDVNGDGFDDMIVGAFHGDDGGDYAGEAYVIYGSASGFGTSVTTGVHTRQVIDLTSLSAAQGFIIQGDESRDYAGRVSSAGDIDGDGYDDLIVGAWRGDDGGSNAGEAYVIFGGPMAAGDTDRSITGTSGADTLRGSDGDDSITGLGGADAIRGGAGDDVIAVADLSFADIDGGSGNDTLALTGSGQTLDLTVDSAVDINSIEIIDLTGSGNNTLEIDAQTVLDTSDDTSNGITTLTVLGDAGDVVNITNWTEGASTTVDGVTYDIYTNGNAQLLIEQGVTVYNSAVMDLTSLNATQGFIIQGDTARDHAGGWLSSAGDINGDGYDDMIVGAGTANGGAGEAYVIFGSASGFGTSVTTAGHARQVIDLTSLTAAQGFIIPGDTRFDYLGFSVSSAGDVNGDGFDDIIVGARYGEDGGDDAGEAYVVFGSAGGFGTADGAGRQIIDLTSLSAAEGFIIQGDETSDSAGYSVSSAGDVNGDGYDDMIVGAAGGDDGGRDAGEVYVVFGSAGGFGISVTTAGHARQVIDLVSLSAAQGFIIQGDVGGDKAGGSVSSAGDINGDGFDDMIVGAHEGDDGGSDAGEAYVLFGSAGGFGTSVTTSGGARQVIDLTSLSAAQGFIIQGDVGDDNAGGWLSSAGDVNGDGYDDMIVGARLGYDGGADAGEAYVLFGSAGGFGTSVTSSGGARQVIDLTSLTAAQGFIIQGDEAQDGAGSVISSAGDVNGDGYDDIIIGARAGDDGGTNAGEAYVIYGSASGFGTSVTTGVHTRQVIDLTHFDAAQGFIIQGDESGDFAGAVSSAGDIDGDGYDDLIVGAWAGDDGGADAGEAYVIYGGPMAAGTADQSITGTAGADTLRGSDGADSITGLGGADVIRGGAGDDVIAVADLTFADIDGGNGSDALSLTGSGQTLDLTASSGSGLPAEINSIEIINLTGSGNNTLEIDRLAVLDTSTDTIGGVTTLTVRGNAGDTVSFGETGWTQGTNVTVGSVTYESFTNSGARVLIELGMSVNDPNGSLAFSETRVSIESIGYTVPNSSEEDDFAPSTQGFSDMQIMADTWEIEPSLWSPYSHSRSIEASFRGYQELPENSDNYVKARLLELQEANENASVKYMPSNEGTVQIKLSDADALNAGEVGEAVLSAPYFADLQAMVDIWEQPFWSPYALSGYADTSANNWDQFDRLNISDGDLSGAAASIGNQDAQENSSYKDTGFSETRVALETLEIIDLGSGENGFNLNQPALDPEEVEAIMAAADMQPPFWSLNILSEPLETPEWDQPERSNIPVLEPLHVSFPMDDLGG